MIKILIADDEPLVRAGIKAVIPWNDHGFDVIGEVSDGNEAYEKILALKPDILITDIKMPGMDGDTNWTNVEFVNNPFKGCSASSWAPSGYALVGQEINTSYKDNIDNHTLVR